MFFREPGSKLLLLLSFLIGGEGGKGWIWKALSEFEFLLFFCLGWGGGYPSFASDPRARSPGFVCPSADSRRTVVSYWQKFVQEVLVNCLGGLSLPRKSVVTLTGRPDMITDVYCGV